MFLFKQPAARRDLPPDAWVQILKHVPQKDRLGSCSLVATSFNTAAAEATDSLSVVLHNEEQQQQRAEAFEHFLQLYGGQSPAWSCQPLLSCSISCRSCHALSCAV